MNVSEFWMLSGREFQRIGAAMMKALSLKMWCLVSVIGVRRLASAEGWSCGCGELGSGDGGDH